MNRRILLIPIVMSLAALSACRGDGDDDETATPTSTATSATASATTGTATASASATGTASASATASRTATASATASASPSASPSPFTPIGTNPSDDEKTTTGVGTGQATVVEVRTATHQGWDRIVVEFEGTTLPAATIGYIDEATSCGSGDTVDLDGEEVLSIRLGDSVAHNEQGQATSTIEHTATEVVEEMALTCDFEAVVSFAAGLSEDRPFVVGTLDSPPRLVIDIQH